MRQAEFRVMAMETEKDEPLLVAQPNARVVLSLPSGVQKGDMLRRLKGVD